MDLRSLTLEFLPTIVEMDKRITGSDHSAFFEKYMQELFDLGKINLLIGAFGKDEVLQGFLLAEQKTLAFGKNEELAYLELIEVDPQFQKHGIGTFLVNEFQKRLRELKIQKVITFVDWKEIDLLNFFKSQGFQMGGMINLERAYSGI